MHLWGAYPKGQKYTFLMVFTSVGTNIENGPKYISYSYILTKVCVFVCLIGKFVKYFPQKIPSYCHSRGPSAKSTHPTNPNKVPNQPGDQSNKSQTLKPLKN